MISNDDVYIDYCWLYASSQEINMKLINLMIALIRKIFLPTKYFHSLDAGFSGSSKSDVYTEFITATSVAKK